MYRGFGQAGVGISLLTSVIDTGIAALTAVKANKLQQQYLDTQKTYVTTDNYVKNVVLDLQNAGLNIVNLGVARPGTPQFETALKQKVTNDMVYQGNCNANVYEPLTAGIPPNSIRNILGTFYSDGSVTTSNPSLALGSGLTWSSGCQNAYDAFDTQYVKLYKQDVQFQQQNVALDTTNKFKLLLQIGLGTFILSLMIVALSTQQDVILFQSTT